MIAMRADAMSGGCWDCHDISSYTNLYNGKEEFFGRPLCPESGKKGDQPIQ